MKITRLKINGIENPIGFSMKHITVSWNVENAKGTHPENIIVEIALDNYFKNIIISKSGRDLSCTGVMINLELKPRTEYFVRVIVIDEKNDTGVAVARFETGKREEKWKGKWIGAGKGVSHPVFRKKFNLLRDETEIKKGRLYICGLGLYEAYLNGEKIGCEFLTPNLNDYHSALQVQTYDVTDLLCKDNDIRVFLGDGWYKGEYGEKGGTPYGEEYALIAELHLEYQDGSENIIITDESWEYRASDIVSSSIYNGEIYNKLLWENKKNLWKKAVLVKKDKNLLIDRYSIPVTVKEYIPVKEIICTPAEEIILDMGQNFAGWIEFDADFPKNTEIKLEFGEILQKGNFYNENYRTAKGGFTYVSNGKKEIVRPHFTFFGFRYVKVSGWVGEMKPEYFRGCVLYSDLERTGYIKTGDAKINRLYENSVWGAKSNFIDIPTDCPQRDERLGWTGDAQVFSTTASYHMDTRAFYRKYLWNMRHEQMKRDGGVPAYVPSPEKGPINVIAAIWGDAAAIIPDVLERFYSDAEDLKAYYVNARDWVEYVGNEIQKVHGKKCELWDFGFQFGDWLALDGLDEHSFKGDTPDDFIATIYYYHSVQIVAEMAEKLKYEEDRINYRKLEKELYELLLEHYFTPVGHLSVSTQAAYVAALKFRVFRNRNVLVRDFLQLLQKHQNHIKCGFVGAPLICQVLAEYGEIERAYELLFREDFPSWLYAVNLGATTIWERWNSVLPDGTISGTDMNSLNHYSYGSVIEFLYAYTVGLKPLEQGFQKALIEPKPHGRLKYCNCTYHSNAGKYYIGWEIRENGILEVCVVVPFGCTARICLPSSGKESFEIGAGKYVYEYMPLKDYRQKFSGKSTIDQILSDDISKKILFNVIPQASALLENRAITVEQLKQLSMLGITEKMVDQLTAELQQIMW